MFPSLLVKLRFPGSRFIALGSNHVRRKTAGSTFYRLILEHVNILDGLPACGELESVKFGSVRPECLGGIATILALLRI